ncbi:cupin domain-containing protein [Chelatococcus sp. YT9]|uniref:cupin domain-containing protein n=1 Tax=Chelatococcus sp. YT9 TaxID=2835635 RepID=UPI001BD0293A|nr:cupin domain-containing protein [Chelatococcus sp. YT9]MBS7701254.1 DUF861 domain-containing protein [Chelatococcus sp. YT9]
MITGIIKLNRSLAELGAPGALLHASSLPATSQGRALTHELFRDETSVLSVATSEWAGAFAAAIDQPFHELRLIVSGRATLTGVDGQAAPVDTGEAVILPAGTPVNWRQTDNTAFYSVRFTPQAPAAGGTRGAITIKPRSIMDMRPSAAPAANLLLGEVPQQESHPIFVDETGQWSVGVWRSTAYHRMIVPFPKHEFMYLLGGAVNFTNAEGEHASFSEGDTFFLPKSTVCDWKTGGMWKLYCIYDPK